MTRYDMIEQLKEVLQSGLETYGASSPSFKPQMAEQLLSLVESTQKLAWETETDAELELRELEKSYEVKNLKEQIDYSIRIGRNTLEIESLGDAALTWLARFKYKVRPRKDFNKPGHPVVCMVVEW
jgi:hypothetical protein